MIPLDAITFERGEFQDAPTFLKSKRDGSIAVVSRLGDGGVGLFWLTGSEAGKPSNLEEGAGFYVRANHIEVDIDSSVPHGETPPAGSLLKSGDALALRYETSDGATKILPISGSEQISENNFAAFSNWRAYATDRAGEKPIHTFNSTMEGAI
jgi:hypothetical protein